jgi:phosphoglycolate phosphatase
MKNSADNSQAVIFDLDGTLVDTVEDIANSVNDVLNKFGYPTHSIDFYKENIGGGINDLIERSLPKEHNVTTESYIDSLDHFYEKHLNKNTNVYPFIYEILDVLKSKGIPIAVVSNKRHPFTLQSVNEFFAEYIDITIGSGSDFPLKPDPKSAEFVLNKFNARAENSFFVGDTGYDINTAKNAGMISIGVLWGMSSEQKLSAFAPDHMFENSQELLRFFDSI